MSEYWRTSPLGVFYKRLLVDKPSLKELSFEGSVAEARAIWNVLSFGARREFVEESRKLRVDSRRKRLEERDRRLREKERRLARERSAVIAYYERRAEVRSLRSEEHRSDSMCAGKDPPAAGSGMRPRESTEVRKVVKRPLLPLPVYIPLERVEDGSSSAGVPECERN